MINLELWKSWEKPLRAISKNEWCQGAYMYIRTNTYMSYITSGIAACLWTHKLYFRKRSYRKPRILSWVAIKSIPVPSVSYSISWLMRARGGIVCRISLVLFWSAFPAFNVQLNYFCFYHFFFSKSSYTKKKVEVRCRKVTLYVSIM